MANVEQVSTVSLVSGEFSLASEKSLEIQYYTAGAQATFGLGVGVSTGDVEVYTVVKVWQILDSRALPQQAELLHVEDQKASGSPGGTFTSGSYQTRVLNTVITNEIDGASLATNQITLPAGKYYMEAEGANYKVDHNRMRLRDTTHSIDLVTGINQHNWSTDAQGLTNSMAGDFTISESSVIELQHRCFSTQATNGFGTGNTFGDNERFATVRVWKIG